MATPTPDSYSSPTSTINCGNTPAVPYFRYAEIADVVFAEGYADTDYMGIYMLDPANRWPTAGVSGTDWLDGGTWSPLLLSTLDGTLPTGVTYDSSTGRITYDGSAISADEEQTVRFTQSDSGQVSEWFSVKVLKIDVTWDGTGQTFKQAIGALPVSGNGVLLIKSGSYDYTVLNVINAFLDNVANKETIYFIGEPGTKPNLNVGDGTGFYPQMSFKTGTTNQYIYFKNLDLQRPKLEAPQTTQVINNCVIHNVWGIDCIEQTSPVGFICDKLYLSSVEMYECGSDGTRHGLYLHGVSDSLDGTIDNPYYAYINNFKAYAMNGGTSSQGGETIKSLTDFTYVRNFWISHYADPTVQAGRVSRAVMINIPVYQRTILYNGVIHSNPIPVLHVNRNMASAGHLDPMYFVARIGGSHPAWESTQSKNDIYHGDNATHTYSETGGFADLTPSSTWTPVNAAFWDSIGDISDPTNDTKAFHHYVSFVEFNTEPFDLTKIDHVGVDMRDTIPRASITQFSALADILPVPPNWTERTYLFAGNNSFNGYQIHQNQDAYRLDFVAPTRYLYPYSPDPNNVRSMTYIGGDIYDSVGQNVNLPTYWKI